MKLSRFSSFALGAALLIGGSAALADSRKAPAGPPPGEDYADSYGYTDNGYDAAHEMHTMPGSYDGAVARTTYGSDYGAEHERREHHGDWREERAPTMAYDYATVDDTVMYQGHWVGSMTGSWNGGPVRTWQGTFDSSGGQTHWHGQYLDRPMTFAPHHEFRAEERRPGGYAPQRYMQREYAPQAYGYGYRYREAAPVYEEATVQSQPIITKTVRTYVSYVDVPVRTHYVYKRVWHAAYRPMCGCAVARPAPKPHYHPHVIQGS